MCGCGYIVLVRVHVHIEAIPLISPFISSFYPSTSPSSSPPPPRVVGEEERAHKLAEDNEALQRSVKELTGGLQDLAREHQMLQVFHTRQRDKRWEKDDEVEKCASCAAKFSVSNRKVREV